MSCNCPGCNGAALVLDTCPECGGECREPCGMCKGDGITDCPECGQNATRLISAGSGLIFKGSGFYITDYKKKAGAKSGSSEKSSESKASSDKPKTESKKSDGAKSSAKPTPAKSASA